MRVGPRHGHYPAAEEKGKKVGSERGDAFPVNEECGDDDD